MSKGINVDDNIDFSRAIKNPFAGIAKAYKDNSGEISEEQRKKMMRAAISEVCSAFESAEESSVVQTA